MPFDYLEARARLFNTPLLVTPAKAAVLAEVLASRASWGWAVDIIAATDNPREGVEAGLGDAYRAGPDKIFAEADGVAVIRVRGTLVQRNGLEPHCGMTGYDGIGLKLDAAVADPSIRAVVLDIDSPGGQVPGCFDLADRIFAARDVKPVWAIVNETAASAAYALASQCDRVIVPRTGFAGSVGVVTMHVDWSRALDADGVKVTLIHAGAHKVDGTPYAPLPDEVREDIQADIDAVRAIFVETVARGRAMAPADVAATEAKTFLGGDAVAAGFADAVMAPEDAFQALLDALDGRPVTA
ncbi:MAG: S49 family peptidase [Alphaproteobacteria bacterium]|nr:S49 family peptidase [Alphaproteobacteria bacterium]